MPADAESRLRAAVDVAAEMLGSLAELDAPLGPLTTYRVGGPAAVLVRAASRADLLAAVLASQESGLPILPIGRGSNLLVADAGFPGIAVSLAELPVVIEIAADTSIVTVSAGVPLPVVARKTAAAGLSGFEWAVGVPGSIGGAVRMNAGGHGSDMAGSLLDVTVVDTTTAADNTTAADTTTAADNTTAADTTAAGAASPGERVLAVSEIGLSFRHSELPATSIVVEARLQLAPGDADASKQLISEIVKWRHEHQPGGQNAGSVFVNPVPGEVSAGALVDAAGLRGLRHGSAHVSTKHANFIQADEGGSADDVRALMRIVRDRVAATSGYVLRSEIRLVGFEDGER